MMMTDWCHRLMQSWSMVHFQKPHHMPLCSLAGLSKSNQAGGRWDLGLGSNGVLYFSPYTLYIKHNFFFKVFHFDCLSSAVCYYFVAAFKRRCLLLLVRAIFGGEHMVPGPFHLVFRFCHNTWVSTLSTGSRKVYFLRSLAHTKYVRQCNRHASQSTALRCADWLTSVWTRHWPASIGEDREPI